MRLRALAFAARSRAAYRSDQLTRGAARCRGGAEPTRSIQSQLALGLDKAGQEEREWTRPTHAHSPGPPQADWRLTLPQKARAPIRMLGVVPRTPPRPADAGKGRCYMLERCGP